MIGGSLGPSRSESITGGPFNTGKMLFQAAEAWPMNFGFLGTWQFAQGAPTLVGSWRPALMGLKLHEDWGSMRAAIDACLQGCRRARFPGADPYRHAGQIRLRRGHAGSDRQTAPFHMYHTEGAGGGHAPDIIRVAGEMHCLPSSTKSTNPYTVNTFDEHLDMTMVCHHLNPAIRGDVAFAESHHQPQTIAAEDVLHDIGAISMLRLRQPGHGPHPRGDLPHLATERRR